MGRVGLASLLTSILYMSQKMFTNPIRANLIFISFFMKKEKNGLTVIIFKTLFYVLFEALISSEYSFVNSIKCFINLFKVDSSFINLSLNVHILNIYIFSAICKNFFLKIFRILHEV